MKNQSVKFNFIMNFILTSSSIIFPLITFPYISRVLLPTGTGKVAFATSLISYFTMIAMLGVPTYGIRACAKVRNNKLELSKTVQELLIINILMALVSYTLLFVSISIVPQFEFQKRLLLICSLSIILNVLGVSWLYQALEQYSYITIASIVFKLIAILLMFIFVRNKNDYHIYGLITVISSFGSNILNFIRLRKFIYLQPIKSYNFSRHLKPIFTFFAMTVATTVYTNLDTVMLGIMKGDEAVGLYNAAIKIKSLMVTLVTSLGTVLLPRLSYYYEEELYDQFKSLISKAISFVLLLSIPCCIYFVIYSKEIILFLSGKEYLGAIVPMCLLMPTLIFIGLSNISGIQVLVPTGNEKIVLKSVVAGAIIDLAINYILIPKFGPSGAAFGTLIAEFVVLNIQVIYMKEVLLEIKNTIECKQLVLSILPAMLILCIVKGIVIKNVLYELFFSSILFFMSYALMLILTKERILMGIVKKKSNK